MRTQNTNPEFNPSLFKITLGTHLTKKMIWLKFNYYKRLIEILQQHQSTFDRKWKKLDTLLIICITEIFSLFSLILWEKI